MILGISALGLGYFGVVWLGPLWSVWQQRTLAAKIYCRVAASGLRVLRFRISGLGCRVEDPAGCGYKVVILLKI